MKPKAQFRLGAIFVILMLLSGSLLAQISAAQEVVGPRVERIAALASPRSNSHKKNLPAASRSDRAVEAATYVGSAACSRCHAGIYQDFSKTSMGKSMTAVTSGSEENSGAADFLHAVPLSATVYDAKTNRHYEVQNSGGKLTQSEYELDARGREVFRNTRTVDWIVGANANGLGALIKRGDFLFEAPLSYYTATGHWELSPGYQRGDYGFNRVIAPGCIFCHSGRPQPVAGIDGKYQPQAFSQLTIGCENCHGPGSAHVEAMGEGESYEKGKDPTIVNPLRIAAHLSDDICMSCHQTGDTRVYQPGKTYLDFRPGQPLDRTMAILMVPPTRENPPQEDHVEHYYSMILSKCYRASSTQPDSLQMRCTSCHDPHVEPAKAEAPAYFNGKCMSCHTQQSCTAPARLRAATQPADNCIGCHMQKRPGVAISHSSITNHRIVRTPDEPFPEATFQMTTAQLPDLIRLTTVTGENKPEPGVTLLQAYQQLKGQNANYETAYRKVLAELEDSEPGSALVQAALGREALDAGKLDEADSHLTEALRIDPTQVNAYVDLSAVETQKGLPANAVAMQQKAVLLNPYSQPLQRTLVDRLIAAKQYAEATAAMEKYMENFPEDDFMRKMLAIAREP